MFDNLGTDDSIQQDTDSLGGSNFSPVESGLYDLTIKMAYTSKSQGGALAMNLVFETANGKEIKSQEWMTSGDAKGNRNFYMVKKKGKETGEKAYLPGFNAINSLCLLTVGKEVNKFDAPVTKTIQLYNFDAKGEVPTDVDMWEQLIGQEITAGIVKQVVDKKSKDDSGKYVPTGETREENEVKKYFRMKDGKTVNEITARSEEAIFKASWDKRFTGITLELAKGAKTAGTAGTPTASGAAAPTENLFAD